MSDNQDETPFEYSERVKTALRIVGNPDKANYSENGFYPSPDDAFEDLLRVEKFQSKIWEFACGTGEPSEVMLRAGYEVHATDLIDRGYGIGGVDFLLTQQSGSLPRDLVTNPPYNDMLPEKMIAHAFEVLKVRKLALLVRLNFLEGKRRKKMFAKYPPSKIYFFSRRLKFTRPGYTGKPKGLIAYAWIVWEEGRQPEPPGWL
jgi:hypothetical protein